MGWKYISLILLLLWATACAKSADSGASAKDVEALQGTWDVVSAESNGEPPPPGMLDGAMFVFEKDKLTLLGKEGTYKLDATRSPKTIEFIRGDNRQVGIYELTKDQLRFCVGPSDAPPTSFKTAPHTDCTMFVLRRATK